LLQSVCNKNTKREMTSTQKGKRKSKDPFEVAVSFLKPGMNVTKLFMTGFEHTMKQKRETQSPQLVNGRDEVITMGELSDDERIDIIERCICRSNLTNRWEYIDLSRDLTITLNDFVRHQHQDSSCKAIVTNINNNKEVNEEYSLEQDVLFRTDSKKDFIVLPLSLFDEVITMHHNSICGLGTLPIDVILQKLKETFYLPENDYKQRVKEIEKKCTKCIERKRSNEKEGQWQGKMTTSSIDTLDSDMDLSMENIEQAGNVEQEIIRKRKEMSEPNQSKETEISSSSEEAKDTHIRQETDLTRSVETEC